MNMHAAHATKIHLFNCIFFFVCLVYLSHAPVAVVKFKLALFCRRCGSDFAWPLKQLQFPALVATRWRLAEL